MGTDHCQNHIVTPTPSEASDLLTGIINKHGLMQCFPAREDERPAFLCVIFEGMWKEGCVKCENCSFLEILPESGACSFTASLAQSEHQSFTRATVLDGRGL